VQAPLLRSTAPGLPREPASYPEMLFHFGFAEPDALAGAARAWRVLYRALTPDLIVLDHAPTALLAARGAGIPRVVFGTGFASPPRVTPMPSIRPWQDIPLQRLEASEQRALETANAALRALSAPPLRVFHELFDVEENILATLPELDHYGARPNMRYWGPMFNDIEGSEPQWPEGEGKKLFVYIKPNSPAFRHVLTALRTTGFRTVWFAPGISHELRARLKSRSLEVVREPVDISAVSRSADAAILHGGHGTTAAMLLGGVPVVLLPEQAEQFLLGRNVAALGAGAALNVNSMACGWARTLGHLIRDTRFHAHARAFRRKHERLKQERQQREILARCDALHTADEMCFKFSSDCFKELRA
jgi:UDP:flavonoid glycosyltransferase YjiC (YdhE family)